MNRVLIRWNCDGCEGYDYCPASPGLPSSRSTRSMFRRAAAVFGLTVVLLLAGSAEAQQMIGACPVLPADNIWNTPVDTLPVLANSGSMVNAIGASTGFHADF